MTSAFLVSVRFHDGRYHGTGDWPPAPARLFQALVAAAPKIGDALEQNSREALAWLEQLPPPVIAAPSKYDGQHVSLFVPNNDLDAKGGDIRRIAEVRSATKHIRPRLFDASVPLLYVWRFDGEDTQANRVCGIADSLYQLGRGVDMAWATAEVLDDEATAEAKLAEYPGVIYRPCGGEISLGGTALDCPERGSLESLIERYKAGATRFRHVQDGRITRTEFANAPKPRFRSVAYNSPATRLLFDIRRTTDADSPFAPWPHGKTAALVQKLRDGAVAKLTQLKREKPLDKGTINKVLIGRDATEADKAQRIRIVPLPSIGHRQVDRGIRRVLVEVPPDCPIRADDMAWAFSGLTTVSHGMNPETGEITSDDYLAEQLVPASDGSMLTHYGVTEEPVARLWRSVTPLALPQNAARRRIEPTRMREEAKKGEERQCENRRAIHAVRQALRHAGVPESAAFVRVQREPFEAKGAKADAFATGTRFSKHQLWHVEITFVSPINGPLVLGDGRYTGLGLMAPVRGSTTGVHVFSIVDGLADGANKLELARALRRAVMARVQGLLGKRERLPVFFTGHEDDGAPARRGGHAHLAFVPDLERKRLLIIAPHVIEHREVHFKECDEYLPLLERALTGFNELRAGQSGKLHLAMTVFDPETDPLFAASTAWIASTPYVATRHAKRNGSETLHKDILREIQRRGLPKPKVSTNRPLSLKFAVAVPGPVLLGKNMHFGGGLFAASGTPEAAP